MNDIQLCFYCKTSTPDHHPTCPMFVIDTWPEDEQTKVWQFDQFASIRRGIQELQRRDMEEYVVVSE